MSIEAVASRAKVSKATIYRWWSSKQELAVESFFTATVTELVLQDTGEAQSDFRQQIQQLADLLRGDTGQVMAAMIEGARYDPTLRQAMGLRWVMPRKKWGMARMQKAISDGQCVDGLNADAALEMMYSPIYVRMMFGLGIPTSAEVDAFLNIAFKGIFKDPGDA